MSLFEKNPPAIPSLFVVQIAKHYHSSNLIIDWHNFGYSLMALNLGSNSKIVALCRLYEQWFGKQAYAHLTVTKAMKQFLINEWGFNEPIVVLYDKSIDSFSHLSVTDTHSFLSESPFNELCDGGTIKTCLSHSGSIELRKSRPAILITSTSWTEDEDFHILIEALEYYDKEELDLPDIILFITGKGPLKEYYESLFHLKKFKRVKIITLWLKINDYPKLLGCSDLGLSFHQSSSGLDLPMKIVDMFGCGIPCCALDYNCISELVNDDINGLLFKNAKQLLSKLLFLLEDFPNNKNLNRLKQGVEVFQKVRFNDEWVKNVKPLLN